MRYWLIILLVLVCVSQLRAQGLGHINYPDGEPSRTSDSVDWKSGFGGGHLPQPNARLGSHSIAMGYPYPYPTTRLQRQVERYNIRQYKYWNWRYTDYQLKLNQISPNVISRQYNAMYGF